MKIFNIFKKEPEKVITSKIYVDGNLVSETANVLSPPSWFVWWFAILLFSFGVWHISMGGYF